MPEETNDGAARHADMEVPDKKSSGDLEAFSFEEKMKSLPKLPQLSLKKPLAKKPEEPSSSAQAGNAAQPGGHAPIGIKPKHGTAPLSAPGRPEIGDDDGPLHGADGDEGDEGEEPKHDTVPLINAIHVKRPAQATAPRRQELERPMQLKPNAGKPPEEKGDPEEESEAQQAGKERLQAADMAGAKLKNALDGMTYIETEGEVQTRKLDFKSPLVLGGAIGGGILLVCIVLGAILFFALPSSSNSIPPPPVRTNSAQTALPAARLPQKVETPKANAPEELDPAEMAPAQNAPKKAAAPEKKGPATKESANAKAQEPQEEEPKAPPPPPDPIKDNAAFIAAAKAEALAKIKEGQAEQGLMGFGAKLKSKGIGGSAMANLIVPLAMMAPDPSYAVSCVDALLKDPAYLGKAKALALMNKLQYQGVLPQEAELGELENSPEARELKAIAALSRGDFDGVMLIDVPESEFPSFWKTFVDWRRDGLTWKDNAQALLKREEKEGHEAKAAAVKLWLGTMKIEEARELADALPAPEAALLRLICAERYKKDGNNISAKILFLKALHPTPNPYKKMVVKLREN